MRHKEKAKRTKKSRGNGGGGRVVELAKWAKDMNMMTSACCPLPRPLNAITLNLSYYSFTLFVCACVCTTFARIGLWLWLKLIAHEVIEFHRTQVERGRGRGMDTGRGWGEPLGGSTISRNKWNSGDLAAFATVRLCFWKADLVYGQNPLCLYPLPPLLLSDHLVNCAFVCAWHAPSN